MAIKMTYGEIAALIRNGYAHNGSQLTQDQEVDLRDMGIERIGYSHGYLGTNGVVGRMPDGTIYAWAHRGGTVCPACC